MMFGSFEVSFDANVNLAICSGRRSRRKPIKRRQLKLAVLILAAAPALSRTMSSALSSHESREISRIVYKRCIQCHRPMFPSSRTKTPGRGQAIKEEVLYRAHAALGLQ